MQSIGVYVVTEPYFLQMDLELRAAKRELGFEKQYSASLEEQLRLGCPDTRSKLERMLEDLDFEIGVIVGVTTAILIAKGMAGLMD